MTASWNGLPDQPERSGWYWLAGRYFPDTWVLEFWNAKTGMWGHVTMSPELCAQRCIYGGPVLTPSELAQMRKDERERAIAAVCNQKMTVVLGKSRDAFNLGIRTAIASIRALTDDEGKKS